MFSCQLVLHLLYEFAELALRQWLLQYEVEQRHVLIHVLLVSAVGNHNHLLVVLGGDQIHHLLAGFDPTHYRHLRV